MAPRPLVRPCIERRCPELTEGTRCEEHQALWEKRRNGSSHTWRARVRPAILQRDRHTCRDCHRNALELARTGIKLTVHHIDQDPTNNVEGNLITLCRTCHDLRHTIAGL